MGQAIHVTVELTEINCGQCGGTYAINERKRAKCNEDGTGWHCPYCQTDWGYFKNGENARLKRELEEERAKVAQERKRKEWAEQEAKNADARRAAAVGQVTKLKKRIAGGACPCCKRSFQNLHRHMTTKHPDFTKVPA